ncbi:MAG: 4-(cytidine 5'-diphospho)-2-C-methyl-D-erythritol kinase [Candidatus Saganbacteria bacterium]|nr:4-(cytidine 5'-diphospho)-2-C-methyl-D-erythritol kinase [Candidatus Saganbacteria bacterium]
MRLRANAKINLSLKILGRRPDGFHELGSVMQSVSLADIVTLTPIPSGIELAADNLRLPVNSKNLAYRAAEVFFSESRVTGRGSRVAGIKIYLEKNIPLAAGLAGGSADAAAVLYGLNKMSGNQFSPNDLSDLGAMIGSDVPFCLKGGNCTVKGRGELVARNTLHATRAYVLVTPEIEVPTKWAYEAWDEMTNDELRMTNEGTNDLEPVVIKKYPIIQKVKDKLKELGCGFTQMSGSGPTVFGAVGGAAQGEKIVKALKGEFPRTCLVASAGRGVEELP